MPARSEVVGIRRPLVVSVLLLTSIVLPAGVAVAQGPAAGHGAAAPTTLRADFNNDGAEDLAIGVPDETVGTVDSAGAVNVLYGSVGGGLTGTGSQLFTQDTPGVGSGCKISMPRASAFTWTASTSSTSTDIWG
jgi:FG-GAP repeat